MADDITPPIPPNPPSNLVPVNIEDEMRKSYVDYAMSVIIGRALPDVRDGLKPVHRRILVGMRDMGLASNRAYRKCAKIVGEVMPNYDEDREEPSYLPSKVPNLLVNGSNGIAVGMATNMPPHNLTEICDAVVYLISNPQATLAELMAYIPGPDFPTAGIIHGRSGI